MLNLSWFNQRLINVSILVMEAFITLKQCHIGKSTISVFSHMAIICDRHNYVNVTLLSAWKQKQKLGHAGLHMFVK